MRFCISYILVQTSLLGRLLQGVLASLFKKIFVIGQPWRYQMPQLFIIKICFTSEINTMFGAGLLLVSGYQKSMSQFSGSWSQDFGSLNRKSRVTVFQFQSPECQGPMPQSHRAASPKSQGPSYRIPDVRAPCPSVRESQDPGSQDPDFRLCHLKAVRNLLYILK